MKKKRLLNIIGDIDDKYIAEAAPQAPKRFRPAWAKWAAAAACLCLIAGAALLFPLPGRERTVTPTGEVHLSNRSTAKVSYLTEEQLLDEVNKASSKPLLEYLTEEEMFSMKDMYIFRGVVSELTNLLIDFKYYKEARCVATIDVKKVYRGDIPEGKPIKVLLPCAVFADGREKQEDTGVIRGIKIGMEGIFMPWIYGEDSVLEMYNVTLLKSDLAPCGIADGMRWAFLKTEDDGLVYAWHAYPGAGSARTLDDIEKYVKKMIR